MVSILKKDGTNGKVLRKKTLSDIKKEIVGSY